MTELLQHFVNGLSVGTIYALIALGYTMVYGVLKLINFAHGDVFMVGAFSGLYLSNALGVDERPTLSKAFVVFVGSMLICGVLGVLIERFAYRPLRERARLTALITAIGVSLLLEFGFQLPPLVHAGIGFPPGPTPRYFPAPFELHSWSPGGVFVTSYNVTALAVAVALMVGLQWVVHRTRFGVAMRAVSFDPQIAGLMGINVDRVIAGTFLLGSALAAAAGILDAAMYHKVEPLMGLMLGLKAFVAAVFGGIGSIPGAMVGGLVLGLTEEFVSGYAISSYRDGIAFALLIVVLLVRPAGLFGTHRAEKV